MYFFFRVKTKYISSSVLKIPVFSTHEMTYIWYLPKKSKEGRALSPFFAPPPLEAKNQKLLYNIIFGLFY